MNDGIARSIEIKSRPEYRTIYEDGLPVRLFALLMIALLSERRRACAVLLLESRGKMMGILITQDTRNLSYVFAFADETFCMRHLQFTDVFKNANAKSCSEDAHELVAIDSKMPCEASQRVVVEKRGGEEFFKGQGDVVIPASEFC